MEVRGFHEKRDEERRQKRFLEEKDVLETGLGWEGAGRRGRVGGVGDSGMVLRSLCTLEQVVKRTEKAEVDWQSERKTSTNKKPRKGQKKRDGGQT